MAQLIVDVTNYDLNHTVLDRQAIRDFLPHRYEFEQIDAINFYDINEGIIIGTRKITKEEFWIRGHIPGNPIFPGVLILEASGQIACMLYKLVIPSVRNSFIAFAGIEGVKFRGLARPGDTLVITARKQQLSELGCKCKTQVLLGSKVISEAVILGIPVKDAPN